MLFYWKSDISFVIYLIYFEIWFAIQKCSCLLETSFLYVVSDQGHNICADKQSKPIYFLFNILRIAWDGDITLEETFYIYQSNTKS